MWIAVEPSRFGKAGLGEVGYAPDGQSVILGYDPWKKRHARAFHSSDGVSWTSKGLPGGNRWANGVTNVSPGATIPTKTGLIAFGQDRISRKGQSTKLNGVIWRLGTNGRWKQIATVRNALVTDIATGPDGLLLAGERVKRDGSRRPAVWSSNNGRVWRRHYVDRDGPPPTAVAISDGVSLVLGHKVRRNLSTWTRLWRSQDGGAWSRIELPGGLAEEERVRVRGPVATPSGFLLFTGERDRLGETLWRSDDGLEWERVALADDWSLTRSWVIAQPWPWRSLVIEARAFPASSRQPSLLLTSDGGHTWCRSDGPRDAPLDGVRTAAGPNHDLVMVGGAGLAPRVWAMQWVRESDAIAEASAFPCERVSISEVMG